MEAEKIYPLTTQKRTRLKQSGMVPFSPHTRPLLLGAAICFALALFWEDISDYLLNSLSVSFEPQDDISHVSLLLRTFLTYGAVVALLSLTSTIGQTLMILPIGRHTEGILAAERKIRWKRTLSSCVTAIILTGVSVWGSAHLLASLVTPETSVDEVGPPIMNHLKEHLYVAGGILLFLALGSFALRYLQFFEEHRMTREELLEEARDD